MIGFVLAVAPIIFMACVVVYYAIVWRTTYENHAWWRETNKITGEHRWARKPRGGYSPIPWIDDDGHPVNPPLSAPSLPRPLR